MERIKKLEKAEQNGLAEFLQKMFGRHLLQLGGSRHSDFLAISPINHKIYYSQEKPNEYNGSIVQGTFNELPFLPSSIDVAVVSHVLEFVERPEEVLNEIYNILVPEGHIIIISFNPISSMGLMRLFRGHNRFPWDGRFISIFRMRKLLRQYGFKIEEYKTIGRVFWLHFSDVYILTAKKSLMGVTPIKEKKLVKQAVAVKPYAKPTV